MGDGNAGITRIGAGDLLQQEQGARGIALLVAGILGFIFFGRWQARSDRPILNLALFRRNRVFFFSILAALNTFIAGFAVSFLISLYLQYIHGLSPQTAGLVLVMPAVVMMLFTPVSGRLSDKIEPRLIASAGNLFCESVL